MKTVKWNKHVMTKNGPSHMENIGSRCCYFWKPPNLVDSGLWTFPQPFAYNKALVTILISMFLLVIFNYIEKK